MSGPPSSPTPNPAPTNTTPPSSSPWTHQTPASLQPIRLDQYLARVPTLNMTRSHLKKLFALDLVFVNAAPAKMRRKLLGGELLRVEVPAPPSFALTATDLPIDVIFEDTHLAVINKAIGIQVHPGPGEVNSQTLVNALLHRFGPALSTGEDPTRPGIVHRLDKMTSGLMLIAKTDECHAALKLIFQERAIEKVYDALVVGKMLPLEGTITSHVARHPKVRHKFMATTSAHPGAKTASTAYGVKRLWQHRRVSETLYSQLRLRLHTGRTHQIRVHCSSKAHPLRGDTIYGKKHRIFGDQLCLVARKLAFTHPMTQEPLQFEVPFPAHMNSIIAELERTCVSLDLDQI
eukprot:TRINITY_DN5773_c0_g1_i1.p1 TRINITY_DN5773_c0_g1~~TRINITY_DN5773_c0_g1_i1.p1  ORF type:complete len:373 (-),score=37.62 TRINITY_DN5773_c0_g1_i1:34-1074(-)